MQPTPIMAFFVCFSCYGWCLMLLHSTWKLQLKIQSSTSTYCWFYFNDIASQSNQFKCNFNNFINSLVKCNLALQNRFSYHTLSLPVSFFSIFSLFVGIHCVSFLSFMHPIEILRKSKCKLLNLMNCCAWFTIIIVFEIC